MNEFKFAPTLLSKVGHLFTKKNKTADKTTCNTYMYNKTHREAYYS